MKKADAKIYIFILFIIILSTGCYKPVKFGDVKKVNLEQNNGRVEVKFTLPAENDNLYRVKIKESKLYISLNSWQLGEVKQIGRTIIPASSNRDVEFTGQVEFTNIISGSMGLLSILKQKKINVELKGNLVVGNWFLERKIEFDKNNEVELFKN